MRVTHVMASAAAGGGATYLKWLLPGLQARQVQSALITGRDGNLAPDMDAAGFAVQALDFMRSRTSPTLALQLRRQAGLSQPDIIHVHGTRAAFYSNFAGLSRVCPIVYTAHGIAFRKNQRWLRQGVMKAAERIAIHRVAGLASVSRADLQALRGLRKMRHTAFKYIPNPVDTSRFRPADIQEAKLRLGIPVDSFVIGTVSRLVEQKGVDVLIRAAAQVPGIDLVIVGSGHLEGELKRLAVSLGVNCLFLGERQDIPEILPAFDVFALSSLWEGEPLSLLEAMACGVGCVASMTPGAQDILEQGAAGALFPIGDADALAKVLRRFQEEPEQVRNLGRAGLGVARTRTVDRMVDDTLALYRACL